MMYDRDAAEANAKLSVLIIDDQSHVRTWIRGVLGGMGIDRVVEAVDGRDAISKVTEPGAHFDLILCDLGMPGRDGIATIRSLADFGLDSSVAILSMEEERLIEMAAVLVEQQGLHLAGAVAKPLTAEKVDKLLARVRAGRGADAPKGMVAPEFDVAAAVLSRDLRLLYQPIVEMKTRRFAGVEALVRWKHPELGLFEPSAFAPAAESSDDYTELLVDFALDGAIGCAGRWQAEGRELPVAVSLPSRAFEQLDLPERIFAIAQRHMVQPEMITVQIAHTHVARAAVRLREVGTRLRLKRFKLSVEGFGAGESWISQLQELPFSEMKIDRRFVEGVTASAEKRSVVAASLDIARNLKMVSVAEGVETKADWDLLEELGCDMVQGYYIARPMVEEGLEMWAAQWAARER